MRTCKDCGIDISDRCANSKFCNPCRKERDNAASRRFRERKRAKKIRSCKACGVDICHLHGCCKWCLSCGEKEKAEGQLRRNKSYYQRNREKLKKYAKSYYDDNRGHAAQRQREYYDRNLVKHLWSLARRRAREKSLDFNITIEDVVIPDICPVLAVRLTRIRRGKPEKGLFNKADSPTLDRIDSSKGYIKGNVRVISWRANRLKSDGTLEEMEAIVAYMKRNMKA